MRFSIITIFPDALESYFNSSILKRAQKRGLVKIAFFNPRDFVYPAKGGASKHKSVDDKPFGGGPGMVMKVDPIIKAVEAAAKNYKLKAKSRKIILLNASGKQFAQKTARSLAKRYQHAILIAGHYEGIDERVKKMLHVSGFILQELSIGPYILTGGELPAAVIVDAVSRHIPGVLGKGDSLEEKHGSHPVYTRPEVIKYRGKRYAVPKVLLSGHHKEIAEWRKKHEIS